MNGHPIVSFEQGKGKTKIPVSAVTVEGSDDGPVATVSADQSGLSGAVSYPGDGGLPRLRRPCRACGVGRGESFSIAGRVAGVYDSCAEARAASIGLAVSALEAASKGNTLSQRVVEVG